MTEERKISRRDLFRVSFRGKAEPSRSPDEAQPPPAGPVMRYPTTGKDLPTPRGSGFRRTIPILRPPGAVDEPTFLLDCTRCNACLEACPPKAIIHAPAMFREAAGTPMIDPMRQPCVMCPDFPCIKSCEPGVLTDLLDPIMGTALIVEETCLAHRGSFCTVCSEQCPVEGAINLSMNKPTINEAACTGCGVCQHVCPAPENAVIIMPALSRPGKPAPEVPE